ncbi:MAG: terminase small subunit [Magnetococcales bacterium]|nr:terminase small subunit [Magnetococcales bacterium]
MEHRLTKRQERFVEEYLLDFNVTQAAVRAGYSKAHAGRIGYENLQKVHIQTAIGNRQKQLVVSSGVGPERVVKELTKLAFARVDDLFDAEWNLKNADQVPEHSKAAIASVTKTNTPGSNTTVKVTLASKLGALDQLARILGITGLDKNRDSDDKDLIEAVKAARRRYDA